MKKFVGYFIIILLFVGTGLGIFFGIEYAKNEKYIQENSEKIAEYLDDINELNGKIDDLDNNLIYYQELLEAYENSEKMPVAFYLVENGKQTLYDVQVVEPNGYLNEIAKPEGDFEGWSLTIGGELIESLTSIQITESTNIYGTFYSTVTFMVNDEEYTTQQVGYNKYATEPEDPVSQGYDFFGWTLNGKDVVVNTHPITQDTTFFAKFNRSSLSTFYKMSWNGLTDFSGRYVWTDGEDIYYSNSDEQYILNKETDTWEEKSWNAPIKISGDMIWTDGENIYYSMEKFQYVLNKETDTWEEKTWNGDIATILYTPAIWTDGENIYYSGSGNYILNKETDTWEEKVWNRYSNIMAMCIWTDGENFYYSWGDEQYILNKETDTWEEKTWNLPIKISGDMIWTDEENVYYSYGSDQYILNIETSTWEVKVWNGLTDFLVNDIWTDGENFYYSNVTQQYEII